MQKTALILALLFTTATAVAQPSPNIPEAIYTDPAPDVENPASMDVLHIPSGDVEINGIIYVASGAGPHPTLVLCHGWPGNEKNLDLAQTIRRAGWNVVAFNYRGSWGSPGSFRFANNPQDAAAVLDHLRTPEIAGKFRIDPTQLAIVGHSMGGWVTAMTASEDATLIGAGLISAANMGALSGLERQQLLDIAASNSETLADTSPEKMVDELIASREDFDLRHRVEGLARVPLLVLSSDDGLAPQTDEIVRLIRENGGKKVTAYHAATDHSWSDRRIDLATQILHWLDGLTRSGD